MVARPSQKPAAGKSRRADAYEQILAAIIFGDLPAGGAADEKRIAKDFDLGLAVVRDALSRLALEGMVERHARIGTRVPELGLRELQEVFEARVIFEGAAAALAAERADADDVAALRAAFDGVDAAIDARDFRRVVHMDMAFHRGLAAASRNQQIERIMIPLHNSASRYWYFGLGRIDSEVIKADIRSHSAVIDAIEARDPERAAATMRGVIGVFPDNVRLFMGGSMALSGFLGARAAQA